MKLLFLKDDNGDDVAINILHITHVEKGLTSNDLSPTPGQKHSHVCYVGGTFKTVQGDVEEVAHAIRMHGIRGAKG